MRFLVCLCLCLVAVLASEDPGCAPGRDHVTQGSKETLSPDYVAGPWFALPPEKKFNAWTKRPRVGEATQLLSEIAKNIKEIEQLGDNLLKDQIFTENQIVNSSRVAISELEKDLQRILEITKHFENIKPTQQAITFQVDQVLTELLKEVSSLFLTDAQVRLPFADRLATYTEDLQKVLRAKEDAQCQLGAYLSASELSEALQKYDDVAQKIQTKIDLEVKAAGNILTPNSRRLTDVSQQIAATENKIKDLRNELKQHMDGGQSYIPHEEDALLATLANQRALMDSVLRASQVQTELNTKLKALQKEQEAQLEHVSALLQSLLEDNDVPAQSAFEKPVAVQRLRPNVDPLGLHSILKAE